jgi:holliday junction DNA helicase RuvB
MSNQANERFVTCRCHHCNGGIEFNADDFQDGETRPAECPHCHQETIISVESLRERLTPQKFLDFIGQNRIKGRLELTTTAAKQRHQTLGHVLLIGSSGSGKATLAYIIAREMGATLKSVNGIGIQNAGDLAGVLTNLEDKEILFIEEIDRLQKFFSEYLESAMRDFKLHIILDRGPNARHVRLNLPCFTLIGSTTNEQRLAPGLLSSFRTVENMDDYSIEELAIIARQFSKAIHAEIDTDAADRIARSANGTPSDVLNRLQHIRDFAHVKGDGKITLEVAEAALKLLASSDEKQDVREGREAIPSAVRREVWRRDNGRCVKCSSRKNLEYDHIIPVAEGGSNTVRNIELLCEVCNRAKSDLIR